MKASRVPASITAMLYSSLCTDIEASSNTLEFQNKSDVRDTVSSYSRSAMAIIVKATPIDDRYDNNLSSNEIRTPLRTRRQQVLTINLCSDDEDTQIESKQSSSSTEFPSTSTSSGTAMLLNVKAAEDNAISSNVDDNNYMINNIPTPTPKREHKVLTIDLCSEDEDTEPKSKTNMLSSAFVSPYKDEDVREEMKKRRKERDVEIELAASNFMKRGRESQLRRESMQQRHECVDNVILHSDEYDFSDFNDDMWRNDGGGDSSRYHDYLLHLSEGIPYNSTRSIDGQKH